MPHLPTTHSIPGSSPGKAGTGNLLPAVCRLAGPMLVSALLQNLQSLIDLFWVGRLGSDAVAALAVSGTVMMLLFPLLLGIATGTVALVARATGAGHLRQASFQAGQSLCVALWTGLLLGFMGQPAIAPLCRLLGAEAAVLAAATAYLRIMLFGLFSACLLFVGNSALQGAGNTLTPMLIMALANLMNLALDPLFIFGIGPWPAGGVAGAAMATVLSQATAAALGVWLLMRGRIRLNVLPRDLLPCRKSTIKLLQLGLPSMAQMLSRSLMGLVLFRIVAASGMAAIAGYGIGLRLHIVMLMPCFVLGNAAATLVGQNLGAGQPKRAHRAAWTAVGIDLCIMIASALLVFWLADRIVGAFDSNPAVIQVGAGYLRTVTPFYVFAGLAIVLDRALNGAGCTVSTMVFTILTLWGLQVPLALWLSTCLSPPVTGVWWAICIATTVHGVLSVVWFESKRWQRKEL